CAFGLYFCVNRYKPHAQSHLRASTWKVRPYQLATLIEAFGELRTTKITTEDIERYKARNCLRTCSFNFSGPRWSRRSERWVFPSSARDESGKLKGFSYWPQNPFNRARKLACHVDRCALLIEAKAPKAKGGRVTGGGGRKRPARTAPAKCTCGAAGLRGGPHT